MSYHNTTDLPPNQQPRRDKRQARIKNAVASYIGGLRTRTGTIAGKTHANAKRLASAAQDYAPALATGGLIMGAKAVFSTAFAGSGFFMIMATTALASGVLASGMHWAIQYRQAKKNGTEPPKLWDITTQFANTYVNVVSFGMWSPLKEAGKGIWKHRNNLEQLFNIKSITNNVDLKNPLTWLKLSAYAGAAYAGWTIWEDDNLHSAPQNVDADAGTNAESDSVQQDAGSSDTSSQTHNSEETNTTQNGTENQAASGDSGDSGDTGQDNQATADESPALSDASIEEARSLIGEDADPYLQERLDSAENGDDQAMKDVADALAGGKFGASQDLELAEDFAQHASTLGNEQAQTFLDDLEKIMPEENNEAASSANAQTGAENDSVEGRETTTEDEPPAQNAENAPDPGDMDKQDILAHMQEQINEDSSQYAQEMSARAEHGETEAIRMQAFKDYSIHIMDESPGVAFRALEIAAEGGNEQAMKDIRFIANNPDFAENDMGIPQEQIADARAIIDGDNTGNDNIAECTLTTADNGTTIVDGQCRFDTEEQITELSIAFSNSSHQLTAELDPSATESMQTLEDKRNLVGRTAIRNAQEFLMAQNTATPRP